MKREEKGPNPLPEKKRMGNFKKNGFKEGMFDGLDATVCPENHMGHVPLSHHTTQALHKSQLPARYQRNQNSISTTQQLKLLNSCVAVVGCGGLGCYIIEQLARIGVGKLVIIDPDVFEEHNLNRQLFSSPKVTGQKKVTIAAQRIHEINPNISVEPINTSLTDKNSHELLTGVNVVADAVDNIITRLELASSCRKQGIPLVHGAIAGWYGHICTAFPGDDPLEKIYHNWKAGPGIEQDLGVLPFTPAVIASFEAAEICKILLGKEGLLRNRKLTIDLLNMEIEEIPL